MRRSVFVFILLVSCQSEDRSIFNNLADQNSIWTDTVYYDSEYSGGMKYYGTWKDSVQSQGIWKSYGKIADKDTEGSEIYYRAWMLGFDVYTYVDGHHGGYWVKIDEDSTYVNLTEEPRTIKKTFSIYDLAYGNHNVTITPIADSTFVFVKLVKFVDYSPFEPDTISPITPPDTNDDCIPDTVYLPSEVIHDTIWKTKIIDTLYLQPKIFIKADSLYFELN